MFSGDGSLTDWGMFSYPRYRIEFPPLQLSKPGQYRFRARGLPNVLLTFGLRVSPPFGPSDFRIINGKSVPPPGHMNWEKGLRGIGTVVGVQISDSTGNSLCRWSAPLADWKMASSVTYVVWWHGACRDLRFDPMKTYDIVITVKESESVPPVTVTPVLEGGGNEMG